MTHETFRNAIAEALDSEYAAMIPEHGEHIFSEKFERRMQKLIRRRSKLYYSFISTGLRRAACIVVMFLVVSFTTVMSVEALRKPFLDFLSSIFSDHTTIESVLDLDGDYPETIEERYEITEGLEGFVLEEKTNNKNLVVHYYSDASKEHYVIIYQNTISSYKTNHNTEDSSVSFVEINNQEVMSYYDNQGYYNLVWNNGNYIIELHSNIGENALIEVAKSVKKVE